MGEQINSYDYYKNMREDQSSDFDNRWTQVSHQLGFNTTTVNNRLSYGGAYG